MYQPHYIACNQCNKTFSYKAEFDSHQLSHDVQQIQHNQSQQQQQQQTPVPNSQYMPTAVTTASIAAKYSSSTLGTTPDMSFEPIDVKPTLTDSGDVSQVPANNKGKVRKLPKAGGLLKAYPCDECEKSYTRRDHLQRHKITHTGCRPYSCSICSKAFYRKDKLQRHERTHFKDTDTLFYCKDCGKQCKRKETLAQHEKSHQPKSL